MRIRFSEICDFVFSSSDNLTWVVVDGWVIVVLASPKFAVIEIILVLLMSLNASFLPPFTLNDTIPPNPVCCFLAIS